jgi:hypothetical protein
MLRTGPPAAGKITRPFAGGPGLAMKGVIIMPRSKKQTSFGDFYRSTVRPKLVEGFSESYLYFHDKAAAEVHAFRKLVAIEEIDTKWLAEFERHLGQAGKSPGWRRQILRAVRRVCRRKFPYRFLEQCPWPEVAALLASERPGHYGRIRVAE